MKQEQEIVNLLSEIKENIFTKDRDEIIYSIIEVESVLKRFFPKESPYVEIFNFIKTSVEWLIFEKTDTPENSDISDYFDLDLVQLKDKYNHLLGSMIKEISMLGIPSTHDIKFDKSINIHMNQNQEQTQTTQLSIFLEFIKEDITGKQYMELQEIAKSEKDPETAKPKIIEKLKSFGENVCTNIVASIITNPTIWNSII